jgi:prepilin-type N-terminal cleavage/methylation domain-containing protein
MHRRTDIKKRRAGFSLVEVIVALFILGVGILAFMRFFPIGLRNVQIAQERTVASQLANDRLGRIQMAGPRQLEATGVFGPTFNTIIAAGEAYGNYAFEGYATGVQPMTGSSRTGLKRVTFTVELVGGRRETFVTYITDL